MKYIFTLLVTLSTLTFSLTTHAQNYGQDFEIIDVKSAGDLLENPSEYVDQAIVVRGNLAKVCQKAGCWANITSDGENTLFVKFGDHDFTIPLDATGAVVVHGKLIKKETSVKEQRHLAKDAGMSKKEIRKIKEPKIEYWFMADGLKKS